MRHLRLHIEKRPERVLLACGGLLLLGLLGAFRLQFLSEQMEERRNLASARLVVLEETLTGLHQAEIAQSALLVTGRHLHEQQFDQARSLLLANLERLAGAYANDADRLKVVLEVQRLGRLKLNELQRVLDVLAMDGREAARAMLLALNGSTYSAAMQGLIAHMKEAERAGYRASSELTRTSRRNTVYAGMLVFGFALLTGFLGFLSLRREMAERLLLTRQLEHEALHDALTGLPNRRAFMIELDRALLRAGRQHSSIGVLFLDLDGFKRINDELGHQRGDEVLISVSRQFSEALRKSDLVARLGGDEFAVLVDTPIGDIAQTLAQRLLASVDGPLLQACPGYRLSVSIGIALYPADATDAAGLLIGADKAMYRAKHGGKNQAVWIGSFRGSSACMPDSLGPAAKAGEGLAVAQPGSAGTP